MAMKRLDVCECGHYRSIHDGACKRRAFVDPRTRVQGAPYTKLCECEAFELAPGKPVDEGPDVRYAVAIYNRADGTEEEVILFPGDMLVMEHEPA